MVEAFDKAVLSKIKAYFSNTIFANTATVYNTVFNLKVDSSLALSFPLISIYRPPGFKLSDNQNFAAKMRGLPIDYNELTDEIDLARFLVVDLAYQFDIYAKSIEDLTNITMNIISALNFDPSVEVTQTDTKNEAVFKELYSMTYNNGPTEQSEFSNDDRVYRYALVYEIKNARVVNFKLSKAIVDIDSTLTVEDNEI